MLFKISEIVRERLKPVYLFIYRSLAFGAIVGSLAFLAGWAWIMIFFMFSSTWIAPTVLSNTSDKMLQFIVAYQAAKQNLATLTIARDQALLDYKTAVNSQKRLGILDIDTKSYMNSLAKVAPTKATESRDQENLLNDLNGIEKQVRANAKAGLISNDALVSTLSTITQYRATTTDNQIAWKTTNIGALGTMVVLQTQLEQSSTDISIKKETADAAADNVIMAKKATDILDSSVYKRAFDGDGATLVFVPYDNLSRVKIGSPIYDCTLTLLLCHKAGEITRIYTDEQLIDFPLFNVKLSHTVRGVFAQVSVDRSDAIHSTILFVGSKPLLF